MGPANGMSHIAHLPHCPKFSWDTKNCPWTDGVGNQEPYAHAVKQWSLFHDGLSDNNSNKINKQLRGIVLEGNLYGRAKDLAKSISPTELSSERGADLIVSTIHQRDPLSVVSSIYADFSHLLSIRRGSNESLRNFELRFAAQLSKFRANGQLVCLHESLTAFMLLNNADVDDAQRVAILSAASSNDVSVTSSSDNDAFLQNVQYISVAAILRQCDRNRHKTDTTINRTSRTLGSSSANFRPRGRGK